MAKVDHAKRIGEAREAVVAGLVRGDDVGELEYSLGGLAVRGDLDLADMLIGLAAKAIALGGFGTGEPLAYDGFRQRFLPELDFRGKVDHRGSQYAIYAAAILAGGMVPDLVADTGWWRTELWPYALFGLVAYVRAAAERRGVDEIAIARKLAAASIASVEG
ncbi:MAG: hypothetical protein ACYDA2_05290 [Acidimicrobiales bacterium]